MSDNNLDIRARLTGEDRLSPTVVKLLAKIKSLEEQMQKLGKEAKTAITDIPMEDYVKKINATSKALNGLTKKHLDWAKANGVAGDQAQLTWTKLTSEIIRAKAEHEKYASSTARGSKKRTKLAEEELRQHYKNAVAFKYLYNKVGDQRMDSQRRVNEQLGNLEAAHLRNIERANAGHFRTLSRMRQQAMRSMSQMSNIGNRAMPYAAAAAGATGYAGASALRTRMRMDTAETNMQIFGGLSKEQVTEMRKTWGNKDAIKFGLSPDKMMESYTEVLKAGLPETIARAVTETILKAATGLEMDTTQTTKLAGTAATLFGDMKNLDPKKIGSIMSAISIAARDSKADANEIVAANKRGSSVVSMGMSMEDLSAFTAGGISAGVQQGKAGTFMDHIVSQLIGAKFQKGKRGEQLGKAASLLGLGGKQSLSARMAADPTETLMTILEKTASMKPMQQQQIAHLIGQDQWSGEFLQFVQVREKIRELLTNIKDTKNASYLDESSAKKLLSLQGRWKSLTAAFSLFWESVGAGLEKAFGQITDFFTDYLGRIDTSKITATVEAFTDGLVAGLGFDSWTDMLKAAFGDPETVKSWSKEVFGFTKGFMGGMKEMFTVIGSIWSGLMSAFGVNTADPESIGKFTARIIEFGVALKAIGSLAEAMSGIVSFLKGITAAIMIAPEIWAAIATGGITGGIAAYVGKKLGDWWNKPGEAPERKKGESDPDFQKRIDEYTLKRLYQPSSYSGATDFSGRRRTTSDDLAENLNKFTGKIERASFINSGPGGLQYAAMGGSGRGLSGSGGGGLGGRSFIGGVPGLITNTPGTALPSTGGGIIRRDNIPSFSGGGGSVAGGVPGSLNRGAFERVFGGTPMAGKYDQVVAAARRAGVSPALLAGVMAQETGRGKHMLGNNPGGIMGPGGLKQFDSLDSGIDRTALAVAKNFNAAGGDIGKMGQRYAPVGAANDPNGLNKSWVPGVSKFMGEMGDGAPGGAAAAAAGVTPGLADKLGLRGKANFMHGQYGSVGENMKTITLASGKKVTVNAAAAESFKGFADELEASGYNINSIGGFNKRQKRGSSGWSQHAYGNAIDINPGANPQYGGTDMPGNVRDMAAKYGLSWGGDWSKRYRDPMHFEWNGTQPWKNGVPPGVTDQVPASSVIQNVPSAPSPASSGMQQAMRGGGPVAIHINGSSHDPEALATLVQRRIDESMNWRTHDTSSEYT